jgi:hypothetical protein
VVKHLENLYISQNVKASVHTVPLTFTFRSPMLHRVAIADIAGNEGSEVPRGTFGVKGLLEELLKPLRVELVSHAWEGNLQFLPGPR